jgi:hypothetical protein
MRPLGALMVLVLALCCCDKDKPKPEETKKEATPVPSNLVFNDFLPTTGPATGLGVRDAGVDGALAAVGGGEPGEPGAAPPEGAGGRLKVVEPGSEPRAVRKYTFVANRTEKRILTVTQSVVQTVGGQSSPGQEVTLKLFLDLTAKQVKPAGATIEAKVTKVELPGAPPQAAQMLASMTGLSGTFDVTPHGEAGEVSFAGTAQMKNQLAETIVQSLSQATQLLLAPFPEAPIGAGARWEMGAAAGPGEQGTKKFALKEVSGEGGVVEADIEIKVPRRATQAPRGGGMMFVEVDGKGKYGYQVRFNGMSTKVDGELSLNEKIEVPGDPRQGGGGGKQTIVQSQKAKHLLETAK